MSKFTKATATQDDSGHWYVIPSVLLEEFNKDLEDETLTDTGEFDDKWGQYRTGGDLNLKQLYAKFD